VSIAIEPLDLCELHSVARDLGVAPHATPDDDVLGGELGIKPKWKAVTQPAARAIPVTTAGQRRLARALKRIAYREALRIELEQISLRCRYVFLKLRVLKLKAQGFLVRQRLKFFLYCHGPSFRAD
jgi:hypothetical protein